MNGTGETQVTLPERGKEIRLLDTTCDNFGFTAIEINMFEEQAVLIPTDTFHEEYQRRIIKAVILGLSQEFAHELLVGHLS